MKFDIDCARDILLTVEACKLNDVMYIKDLKNELFQYDPDEISYMCLKLYEADFINATCKNPLLSLTLSVSMTLPMRSSNFS